MSKKQFKVAKLIVSLSIVLSPILMYSTAVEAVTPFKTVQTTENTTSENFKVNTLTVKYKTTLTTSELTKMHAKVIKNIPTLQYAILAFQSNKAMKKASVQLVKNKKITSISASPLYKTTATNDPKAKKQYMHDLLQTDEALKLAGKNKVKVAVIDEGIDANHPDLLGIVSKTKNSSNPLQPASVGSHGTHVAGIIAAKKGNGIGGYGINPQAEILGYDVFDGSDLAFEYIISTAIIKATDDGAKIINMSLGSSQPSDLMKDAVQYALDKNVVIVAAAGNSGSDSKEYPAGYEGVISVGSVDDKKVLSTFSSYNASMDIVAPGGDIYSSSYDAKRGSTFETMSGTSMASPAVAGAISLLIAKNPTLTTDEIRYIMTKTATDLGDKGVDLNYANGLINPVAMLKYDTKKIPKFIKKSWSDKMVKQEATIVKANKQLTGKLSQPFEQKWVKIPVTKGQPIQVELQGSARSDLKLSLKWFSTDEDTTISTTVKRQKVGQLEAKFIRSPINGELAIGINDINSYYSTDPYSLIIKSEDLMADESSRDEPIPLTNLDEGIVNQYFQDFDDQKDEDVVTFTAQSDKFTEVTLSAIPNSQTTIAVYEVRPDQNLEEEDLYSNEIIPQLASKRNEPLQASFETKKNHHYYIVTSNENIFTFESIFEEMPTTEPSEASLTPYSLVFKQRDPIADEDRLMKSPETDELQLRNDSDEDSDLTVDSLALVETYGQPFSLTKPTHGYLSDIHDLDGYYFTTDSTSEIWMFDISANKHAIPSILLYEVNNRLNIDGSERVDYDLVTDNYSNDLVMDGTMIPIATKPNKTYLMTVSSMDSAIGFDGYTISPRSIMKNTEDLYEDNNDFDTAAPLPSSGSLIANTASFNDIDHYYYTAPKTGIVSINYALKKLSKTADKKIPTLLQNQYLSIMVLIKDTNKNKKVEPYEEDSSILLMDVKNDLSLASSLEVKKGERYFISVIPLLFENFSFSVMPYELKMVSATMSDEDQGNKVTKNQPSKPIKLLRKSTRIYEKTAYMNTGLANGDVDWFTYQSQKSGKSTVTLTIPQDLDGVLEVYKDGKRLAKSDYYGKGDAEIIILTMRKGQYDFKVTERQQQASTNHYKLTIKR